MIFRGPSVPVAQRADVREWSRMLAPEEPLKGLPEVLHPVGVQEGIQRRVQVRQNDERIEDPLGRIAMCTEGLHAIERVQREPAYHEEDHD